MNSNANSEYKIEGIGIGCPGVVTPGKGIVENHLKPSGLVQS
jgi:hypothetical protein